MRTAFSTGWSPLARSRSATWRWTDGSGATGRSGATALRLHADQGIARTLNAFLDLCGRVDVAHCAFSKGSPAATRAKYAALLQRLQRHPRSAKVTYAETVSTTGNGLGMKANWPSLAKLLEELSMPGNAKPHMVPAKTLVGLSAI